MKRIVFIIGNYKNGGMAMQATNLSNEFAKHGYSVDILVTREIGCIFFSMVENVNVISVKEYNNSHNRTMHHDDHEKRLREIKRIKRIRLITKYLKRIDKSLSRKVSFLRRGVELRDYFLNNKPDIVIPFGIFYLEPAISAATGLNCRIIYAEKNAPEQEFPQKGSDELDYIIHLLQSIDGVVVQTDNEKQFFDGALTNIHVINNPIKQGLPLPYTGKRKKTIVNFCRMSTQKNLGLLIDSFARLVEEFSDFKLIIYGNTVEESEIEYKESLMKKVNDLGLSESVYVFPPAADVHSRVLDSAMFVSSSDYEGLSNSMIEAMAIGLPCICTDCLGGGTREVMVDGINGLIVPMNDVEAMYKAMRRFIENPRLAEQCGQNASKIREKLDVEVIAQKWIDIFQR